MTTQIEAMHKALRAAGINANIYKGQRVYLNGFGKDITAYITFDEPDATEWSELYSGCALKVFTDAGGGKWAINRRQDVMHEIGTKLHRAGITSFAPAENPRDMVPMPEDDEA